MEARPLTKTEAAEVMANTMTSAVAHGVWIKLCAACGETVGARLAEYGRPTPEDLSRCACPYCGGVGATTSYAHGR